MTPKKQPADKLKPGPKTSGVSRVQVTLRPDDIARASLIGNGNVSLGIRIALQKTNKKK